MSEGIAAQREQKDEEPRGLGDFQRRLNRDREWGGRRRNNGWDSTPRSDRGRGEDAPSVRIPDAAWDSTPRTQAGDGGGWGTARNRRWDAPTPRAARGGSPDAEEGALALDAREWEEEQIRLDRDWYMGAEEGALAGDEEHNPLAMYDDLEPQKQAELEKKQVVSWVTTIAAAIADSSLYSRKKYQPGRRNMYVR